MKYIIETKSSHIRQKYINSLMDKNNIPPESFFVFDFEDKKSFSLAYNQYLSSDLFDSKKMIIIKNYTLLNAEKLSKSEELISNDFLNVESENILILTIDKIKKTKSQWKKYSKVMELLSQEVPKGQDLISFSEKYLKKYNIAYDMNSIKSIIHKSNDKFDLVLNELNKFRILNEPITMDLVSNIVYDHKGDSVFDLIDSLFSNNSKTIKSILNSLTTNGVTAITILQFLISDLTLILQTKINLEEDKYFDREAIAKKTGLNSYRLLKAKEKADKWPKEKLYLLLNDMIELENKLMINNPEESEFIIRTKLISSKI